MDAHMAADAAHSKTEILWVIHNVFLPPRLPQVGDGQSTNYKSESLLLSHVQKALERFSGFAGTSHKSPTRLAQFSIESLLDLRDDNGFIDAKRLQRAFNGLQQHGMYQVT